MSFPFLNTYVLLSQVYLLLLVKNNILSFRHLMKDLISLCPHSKTESKMRRGDSLFSANEMAEMKNCNKCVLFEGRKQRDLYMWIAGKNYSTFIKLEGRQKV